MRRENKRALTFYRAQWAKQFSLKRMCFPYHHIFNSLQEIRDKEMSGRMAPRFIIAVTRCSPIWQPKYKHRVISKTLNLGKQVFTLLKSSLKVLYFFFFLLLLSWGASPPGLFLKLADCWSTSWILGTVSLKASCLTIVDTHQNANFHYD